MQTTLSAILERLAQTDTRAHLRRTSQNYTDETHMVFLSLDLRELLRDIDDSLSGQLPARRRPAANGLLIAPPGPVSPRPPDPAPVQNNSAE